MRAVWRRQGRIGRDYDSQRFRHRHGVDEQRTDWCLGLRHLDDDGSRARDPSHGDRYLPALQQWQRRELVFERQKELGIFPASAELSPLNPHVHEESVDGKPWPPLDVVRPWDSLSDDERKLFCRMAEVYAGFLSHAVMEIWCLTGVSCTCS